MTQPLRNFCRVVRWLERGEVLEQHIDAVGFVETASGLRRLNKAVFDEPGASDVILHEAFVVPERSFLSVTPCSEGLHA